MSDLQSSLIWERFKANYHDFPDLGLSLDFSRVNLPAGYFQSIQSQIQSALDQMRRLEAGDIVNYTEGRQVGHYWLRNAKLAPPEYRSQITRNIAEVKGFAKRVHSGQIQGKQGKFSDVVVIGIGGSALGPQFVSHALGNPGGEMPALHFMDNTDPDGMDRVVNRLRNRLGKTLILVISKSGGTKETRNGVIEAQHVFAKAGFDFTKQALAVTQMDNRSQLYKVAVDQNWLAIFPMWEWVGGRTSELSAVGLLPAALQGIDIDAMLQGAHDCDEVTRTVNVTANPSMLIASLLYLFFNANSSKCLVFLPYKDRLELMSKYLQQLIMESLGKEANVNGSVVHHGVTVFGNKGSTDQHAYVQQLRDGPDNFIAAFIDVLKDRDGESIFVEPEATSGDFLLGFMLGTRTALFDKGRGSFTLTITEISPYTIGLLIALFERVVGFYAAMVGINAYDQPGVEAGKKAAEDVLSVQRKVLNCLRQAAGTPLSVDELAEGLGLEQSSEVIFKVCEHMSANHAQRVVRQAGSHAFGARYSMNLE